MLLLSLPPALSMMSRVESSVMSMLSPRSYAMLLSLLLSALSSFELPFEPMSVAIQSVAALVKCADAMAEVVLVTGAKAVVVRNAFAVTCKVAAAELVVVVLLHL